VVQRCRAHTNSHVGVVRELGHRKVVAQLDAIEPSVRRDRQSSHSQFVGYIGRGMLCGGIGARKPPGAADRFATAYS
jgi:hypothetical protein